MKILADKYIPFLQGILEPFAEVHYLEPDEFTPASVQDADALLVRTRTRCNSALLQGSAVRFIGTATIGFDHIDTAWCDTHHIAWTNAPGCNAQGVCDYVEAALHYALPLALRERKPRCTIGVVGVGHVGSLVADMAARKGFEVLLNDPPKHLGVSLEEIASRADVITFHTPLTASGKYPTRHLCNDAFLQRCKPDVLIINAARGGIIDEAAALTDAHRGKTFVIDTWEGEPHICPDLLQRVAIGTYHIAGYTLQGKINATNTCLAALCRHFGLPVLQIDEKTLPLHTRPEPDWIMQADRLLRQTPERFEVLRETYKLR